MDVSKLFEPGEIRHLSKDETIALYKRHMLAQHERAERLQQALHELIWAARYVVTMHPEHDDTVDRRSLSRLADVLAGLGSEQGPVAESGSAGLPDTPAIPPRPPIQPPGHQREMADTRAESQGDKT